MNDERPRRAHTRGPVPVAILDPQGQPDPFQDIGQVAREARGQPQIDDAPDDTAADLPDAPAEQEKPLDERAAHVLDSAQVVIVDNIDTLIKRAERLKASIMEDVAQVRTRIKANLNHGARILELSKTMNTQLDELEAEHRASIRGQ